jgi:hypothetical protein
MSKYQNLEQVQILMTTKWKKEEITSQNTTFNSLLKALACILCPLSIDGIGLTGKY